MQYTKTGFVNIDSIYNEFIKEVDNINLIIKDILNNLTTVEDRKNILLDPIAFENYYNSRNYEQNYKAFIYYGFRKYNAFTNFYLDNEDNKAIEPLSKSTDILLNDILNTNLIKNRAFDFLIQLASIDIAQKYLFERTAFELFNYGRLKYNIIADEILGYAKSDIIGYKENANLIIDAFFNDLLDNKRLLPDKFIEIINYLFNEQFEIDLFYFKKEGNKIYLVKDDYKLEFDFNSDNNIKFDITEIPINKLIFSPYFFIEKVYKKEYFDSVYKFLRFISKDTNTVITINLVNQNYNFTIQELIYIYIMILIKYFLSFIFKKPYKFKKINVSQNIINNYRNLINTLKQENSEDNFVGFIEFLGLYQIIIQESNEELIEIYNNGTLLDLSVVLSLLLVLLNNTEYYQYIMHLYQQGASNANNYDYTNITGNIDYSTIKTLSEYLVELPYRLFQYIFTTFVIEDKNRVINIKDLITKLIHSYKIKAENNCLNSLQKVYQNNYEIRCLRNYMLYDRQKNVDNFNISCSNIYNNNSCNNIDNNIDNFNISCSSNSYGNGFCINTNNNINGYNIGLSFSQCNISTKFEEYNNCLYSNNNIFVIDNNDWLRNYFKYFDNENIDTFYNEYDNCLTTNNPFNIKNNSWDTNYYSYANDNNNISFNEYNNCLTNNTQINLVNNDNSNTIIVLDNID